MVNGIVCRKTSLIDFPGRVSAVLFLPGCNFRCPYCQNAALVSPDPADPDLAPLGEFLAFLDRRRRLVSGLVISGGEPLLHEETPGIAAAARERGLAVKLDTNGYFPERIGQVLADYVALDFKTAPSSYRSVAPALADAGERVTESLRWLRRSGIQFEIRITCAPGIVDRAELEKMLPSLEPTDRVILQVFRPGGCLDPDLDIKAAHSHSEMEALLALVRGKAPGARIRGDGWSNGGAAGPDRGVAEDGKLR